MDRETVSILIAVLGLAMSVGVLLFKGGRGEGHHEARFDGISRDIERLDLEVKRLRDWRHDVGEKPGYAAVVRLDDYKALKDRIDADMARRIQRIENALNGLMPRDSD